MDRTEATISWDVSGYYLYLPAIFIYKDLKKLEFGEDIISKYHPAPGFDQAFLHESGNYVMKYPVGQAIQYLPFFSMAHLYAINSDAEADGFSRPYQFMISIGSLFIAFIGLFFLRKNLLHFFSDTAVSVSMLTIVFASNYLDYSAINGAMTHNYLFTIYSLLIFITISFYRTPSVIKAVGIGMLVGLAAITRPTEIISILIPAFWGISMPLRKNLLDRISFFRNHKKEFFSALFTILVVGSLQLSYWKYVSGEWLVYSYQDQGFSWFKPHLLNGLFSYRSGWLIYSPAMLFALLGFLPLFLMKEKLFWSFALFTSIFIYIAFAWNIWWYGGSLGQRAMVQSYAILAFPLCAWISWIEHKKIIKYFIYVLIVIFIYYNLWLTHQAHRGGLLHAGHMTKAYFWNTLGRYQPEENVLKLLDTDESFCGERKNVELIYKNDFEKDTVHTGCNALPIEGEKSLCLNEVRQWSPAYIIPFEKNEQKWIRVSADFHCILKEWDVWKMTQFIVTLSNDEKEVKSKLIRVHRLLNNGELKNIYLDVKLPIKKINTVKVKFWNADGTQSIMIDNLKIESFQ